MMRKRKSLTAILTAGMMVLSGLPVSTLAEQETHIYSDGLCEHHQTHTAECGYAEGVAAVSCSHEHTQDCYTISQNCVCISPGESGSQESFTDVAGEAYALFTSLDMGEEEHVCSVESGCITEELNCLHQHDEACGYTEGVKGVPCSYVCEICNGTEGDGRGEVVEPIEPGEGDAEEAGQENPTRKGTGENKQENMITNAVVLDESVTKVQELIDALPFAEAVQSMTREDQRMIYEAAQEAYDAYRALSDEQKAQLTGVEKLEGLLALFSGMVNGLAVETNVTYMENGEVKTCLSATVVTADDTEWTDGWYVVKEKVVIGHSVLVTGNVHLILEDGCSLSVTSDNSDKAGIQVEDALNIYGQNAGTGSLHATGGENGAGIGGGWRGAGGTIRITGGTVTATSEIDGAGIGGGGYGTGGKITISGGEVAATGEWYGAGIGGGYRGDGGEIIINGGEVTATSKISGAGIGGGGYGGGGEITISGGEVTATGEQYGAGIGGGYEGAGGTIEINGGTVTAAGDDEAGIGDGYNSAEDTKSIIVSGGSVKLESKRSLAFSIQPKDEEGTPVYLAKVEDQSGVNVIDVDGKEYKRAGDHPNGDGAFYLYLPGKDHTITTNGITYKAKWYESTGTFRVGQYVTAPEVRIQETTASTITVTELPDQNIYGEAEYSLDETNWQTSNVFTDLHSQNYSGSYTVFARYKGNEAYLMSDTGKLENVTTKPASYTVTIPSQAVAGGDPVYIEVNKEKPFDPGYGGKVTVKIADTGDIKDGNLILTRDNDPSGQSITSELLVGGKPFTDLRQELAVFKTRTDQSTALAFKKPTDTNIAAGTYRGTVIFTIDYTE